MKILYQYSYTLSMKEKNKISISYSYTAQNTIKDYTIWAHPCEHTYTLLAWKIRGTLNISTTLVLKIWYTGTTLIFSSLPRAHRVKAQVHAAQLGVTTFVLLPESQWSIGTKLSIWQFEEVIFGSCWVHRFEQITQWHIRSRRKKNGEDGGEDHSKLQGRVRNQWRKDTRDTWNNGTTTRGYDW